MVIYLKELIKIQNGLSSKVSTVKEKLDKAVIQAEEIKKENPIENEALKPLSGLKLNLDDGKKFKKKKKNK